MSEPNQKLLQELEQLSAIAWALATAMQSEQAERTYRLGLAHISQCLKGICQELKQEIQQTPHSPS